ncbi:MAG: PepSY domain-containing protein [Bacteroidota bacterium]
MQNRALIRKKAGLIRKIRKVHKYTGIYFLVFILIITITGLLLAWKKNADHVLSIPTYEGVSTELASWLPLDELEAAGKEFFRKKFGDSKAAVVDRIDIRPGSGSLKILFKDSYYEIQLDGKTGEILHAGYRISDIIENIHDGSIIDRFFKNDVQLGKLLYSTLLGLVALTYAITGFLLWNERRKIRKMKD